MKNKFGEHLGIEMSNNFSGSTLTGANLENEYELVQFHFHWGEKDGIGSEHAIDNVKCKPHLTHSRQK